MGDSGIYKAVVKNKEGEITAEAKVDVAALQPKPKGEPPKFTQKLLAKIVNEGERVEFIGKLMGTEPMTVEWMKDKKPISNGGAYNITFSNKTVSLKLKEAFTDDAGEYTVTVKNDAGSATSMASLQVKASKKKKEEEKKDEKVDKKKVEEKTEKKVEEKTQKKVEIKTAQKKKDDAPEPKQIEEPMMKPVEVKKVE